MKLILIALTVMLAFGIQSQILTTETATNSYVRKTDSNDFIVTRLPFTTTAPPLVNTNGQASPDGLIAAIAIETGIPIGVLKVVPLKWLLLLAALVFIVPYAGRAWHAWQADGGWKGMVNGVIFGVNTPKQIVQTSGEPVVPASTPETKINSVPETKQ